MFAYNLRLAWLSLRRNPVLSALMVAAVALGIGVCVTTLTVYHLMAGDPIPQKSGSLYRVQMDNWDPAATDDTGFLPPVNTTYRDALAVVESGPAHRAAAMYRGRVVLQPDNPEIGPENHAVRATTREFFAMFDVPFLFGAGWDEAADRDRQRVVVLGRSLNDKLFGGRDSVGETVRLSGRPFRVIGVIDDWNPLPKFYDLTAGEFGRAEVIFLPFSTAVELETDIVGNISCWEPSLASGYESFLESECVWTMTWVELRDAAELAAFRDWLDAYVLSQRELGRFARPMDNRVTPVMEWLAYRRVVNEDTRVLVGLSFLFLGVCVLNAAGLLLARSLGTTPVVALRRALGATRGMIFRQQAVEVGLIGIAGGLIGLGIAALGLAALRSWLEDYERLAQLDWTMVAAAIGLAVAAALAAGLYPAWRTASRAPAPYLKTQ